MSTSQRTQRLLLAGALTVGCLALMASESTAALTKRASESLYDNIYEAISDFTEDELAGENLPAQKRSSRRAQQGGGGFNQQQQQPRAGRQGGTRKVIVDGFPTGLPDGTPKGVQIALASMVDTGEMPPIPGQAGVDYPTLTAVPDTGFDCNAQTFPGIYGDAGADCQVFWMCQPNGNFNGFLCPNGTIFNQQYFICDWWYNSDCGNIQNFYGLNEFIYQDQPEGKKCDSLFCSNE